MHPTLVYTTTTRISGAALALMLVGAPAMAADQPMYRCQDGDQVTFSQEPCGPGAREVDVQYDTPSASDAATADASLQAEEAQANSAAAATEQQQRIEETQRQIESLAEERDRRLAELSAEAERGSENLADDQSWEIMQGTIQAVRDQYDARIQNLQARLAQLRRQ
jgi:hypothetical protein